MAKESKAKQLMNYSFLVVFANDDTIDENELHLMEKLALEDNVVDEAEKEVLRAVFSRVDKDKITTQVEKEIEAFRAKYGI